MQTKGLEYEYRSFQEQEEDRRAERIALQYARA
jgi:uncharacterized membrane protein